MSPSLSQSPDQTQEPAHRGSVGVWLDLGMGKQRMNRETFPQALRGAWAQLSESPQQGCARVNPATGEAGRDL